ncbi:MAG: ABC transporter substrate-binding protein [Candidatus Eremiobacteraeota bacterium]|nr:ABC transporter substrate-binding protein [Candidatus Eremiobacteraeota bacterium]
MMRRTARLVVCLLLLLATLPIRAAEEPYELYVIAGLTGPGAFVGHGVQTSLAAAERYVNATGGISGRPIRFVVLDDQTNPVTAVQLLNQLIAKHVPVVLGPVGAATCTAAMPIVESNNGPVSFCLSNSIRPAAGTYTFSAQLSTLDFGTAAFRYLKAKGVRKIAILTSTDAAGQDGENVAVTALRNPDLGDLQVVANEHFAVGDFSVGAQIARIKAAGAQVIDAWTTGTPFATVLRDAQAGGYDGIVMTNGANLNKALMDQYAAFVPANLIITGPPYMAVGGFPRRVAQAKAAYLDQMAKVGVPSPDLTQMLGWDPAMILIDALRKLGTAATATQVRDYIVKLHDFAGVNGMYDFRRGDQRGLDPRTSVVVRWDKSNERFVTVSKPGGTPLDQ